MNEVTFRTPPHDPLGNPDLVRIELTQDQIQQLESIGSPTYVVIHRGSYPIAPNRWQIMVLPVSHQTALDVARVALGQATAKKIKAPPQAKPAQATSHSTP